MKQYFFLFLVLLLVGCSPSSMAVEASLSLVDSQTMAMEEERDPKFAEQAIPANLKMLEGLLKQDPENIRILVNLAKGFCGYAFSFLEDKFLNNSYFYNVTFYSYNLINHKWHWI